MCVDLRVFSVIFLVQAEDGIRDLVRSRGLGDVYKRQAMLGCAPAQALLDVGRVIDVKRNESAMKEDKIGSPRKFAHYTVTTNVANLPKGCLLYTSPSPRDRTRYRMPSSA